MIMNGLSQGGGSDSRVPVIYTTSYIGTGTSGQNNPTSLTFDFIPSFIWIYSLDQAYKNTGTNRTITSQLQTQSSSSSSTSGGPTNLPFCNCNDLTTNYENYKGLFYWQTSSWDKIYIKKSEDGKTISWYFNTTYNSKEQFNQADQYQDYTYHVLALGYKEES